MGKHIDIILFNCGKNEAQSIKYNNIKMKNKICR